MCLWVEDREGGECGGDLKKKGVLLQGLELSEVGWKDQSSCCVGGARLGRGCVMVTVQWEVEGWAGPADVLEWKRGGSGRTPSLLYPVPLDTGMGSGAAGRGESSRCPAPPCPGFVGRGLARDTDGPLRHTAGADSRRGQLERRRGPGAGPSLLLVTVYDELAEATGQ